MDIKDKKRLENLVTDHLSRLEYILTNDQVPIKENFSNEFILGIVNFPWYANFANYLVSGVMPKAFNYHQRKIFLHDVKSYFWEESLLYKHCVDSMVHRYIFKNEVRDILYHCHNLEMGNHFSTLKTVIKVWQSGFYWPTMYQDTREYVKSCDTCQRTGSILRKNEMPLTTFLEVELFDIWGMDFILHL